MRVIAGNRKWVLGGMLSLVALHIFYVRELVAALVLFAVLFGGLVCAAVLLLGVDYAGHSAFMWFEGHFRHHPTAFHNCGNHTQMP